MKRNKFGLSHYRLTTMDMGLLVPLTWLDVMPGDTFRHSTSALIRCSPLLSPVMHPVNVRINHWFVPYRLIWEDFEDFITGGPDGLDASVHPYISSGSISEGDIFDHLGVPPATYSPNLEFNALPLRAYQKIWNEHFRDQDLVTEATIDITSGQDTTTDTTLQHVAWGKDYFTSARPWEQKGTQVTIPLLDEAPVLGIGHDPTVGGSSSKTMRQSDDTQVAITGWGTGTDALYWEEGTSGYPNIRADLAAATGIDLADLRLAAALQNEMEARAKYGSRYSEYLRYLGVRSNDGRLQNPEYLGGGRQTIQFSEIIASADSGSYTVGDMLGHGIAAMRTNRYQRFFQEHGIVMTLMSIIPKSIYSQGLHRSFSRESKEDYFVRNLQFIGDQQVLNKEVYTEHTTPDDIFGYQGRYDCLRSHPSSIAGEFRSTLDHWHYARVFSSDPALNSTFVQSTPTKRVNASSGTDCIYVMANHSIQARRPMAKRAISRL